jgi:hypothetical protein
MGVNGEKLHLAIKVSKASSSSVDGAHPFIVVSKLGQQVRVWPALVVE